MTSTEAGGQSVAELLVRINQQDERLRRIERTMTALAGLSDAVDPKAISNLVDTKRNHAFSTPNVITWPARRKLPPSADPRIPPVGSTTTRTDDSFLRAAVDGFADALVGVDANGIVRVWNPKASRLFGWSAAEVIGKPPPFVPGDRYDEHEAMRLSGAAVDQVRNILTIRQCKDGSTIAVRVSSNPSDEGGVLFTFRTLPGDLNWNAVGDRDPDSEAESDGADEPIAPSPDDLDDADRALTPMPRFPALSGPMDEQTPNMQRLVSIGRATIGIVHDINNLLASIQGYAELLQEQVGNDDHLGRLTTGVLERTALAGEMTRQLLTLVRPSRGLPEVVDVNAAVERCERLTRSIATAQTTLTLSLGPSVGKAAVSPSEFAQVLLNLVQNARDAATGRNTITIRTVTQSVRTDRPGWPTTLAGGEYIVLAVIDSGAGMDPVLKEKILEPFYTTKSQVGGSGIGLMIVQDIVRRANGHLEIDSDPEWGTHVRVFFPKA